jgi:hypothetical protein
MRPAQIVVPLLCCACATNTSPRFEQAIAASFASDAMRVLTTADVEVYYPEGQRAAAERVAARGAECLTRLRAMQTLPISRRRALLFITSANLNNAYVNGQTEGEPLHALNPLSTTSELLQWYGLSSADLGDIACHEMFHYAHFEQVGGLWGAINEIFGPSVPAQVFLERWLGEGVAQYYEGRLGRRVGRPHSPLYRAAFNSFAAVKRNIEAGDLSLYQRQLLPFGGAYLTSLHFVEFLVERNGEAKLWELMARQGRDVFTVLGATLRFQSVYGKDIGDLLAEWSTALQKTPARNRPATQRVLRPAIGQLARLASHPASGLFAIISESNEEAPWLRLIGTDGKVRAERPLLRLDPGRDWVLAGPSVTSGLTFTPDGKRLLWVNDDLTDQGDQRAQLITLEVPSLEVVSVRQGLGTSMGGALHPSGKRYTLIRLSPGQSALVDVNLETGEETTLHAFAQGEAVGGLSWSSDGLTLAFSKLERAGWNLFVLEGDTERRLTSDGSFNVGARFKGNDQLVFTRDFEGRPQAHRLLLTSGLIERISDAPYGVIDVAPANEGTAFLNRDGTGWSLDFSEMAGTPVAVGEPDAGEGWHSPPPLVVESDAAYSALPTLLIPQLRGPALQLSTSSVTFGVALQGRDRLSHFTWGLTALLTRTFFSDVPPWGSTVLLELRSSRVAPWELGLFVGRDSLGETATWTAELRLSRTFTVLDTALSFRGLVLERGDPRPSLYVGPTVALRWAAGEVTSYAGARKRLAIEVSAAGYPRLLGSSLDLADLRGAVSVAVPLPFSTRHSLVLGLSGRVLAGAPAQTLLIGGDARNLFVVNDGQSTPPSGPSTPLPERFTAAVRGYEDFGLRGNGVAIASARYRYAFVIDRGFASLLFLLPSLFFRQVDVEVFGTAAVTDVPERRWLRAVGVLGALKVVVAGLIPMGLSYQLSLRFDERLPPMHAFGLSFD